MPEYPVRNIVYAGEVFFTEDNMLCTSYSLLSKLFKLEMWANAQRDGRPAKYRWRPLFNAAKFS